MFHISGWSDHVGGGSGSFLNKKLILGQSKTSREYNRFYIPEDFDLVKFLLKVSITANGSPQSVDKFKFSLKSINTGNTYALLLEEYTDLTFEKWIEIDITEYKNTVATILLSLAERGGNGINSELQIDEAVRLVFMFLLMIIILLLSIEIT